MHYLVKISSPIFGRTAKYTYNDMKDRRGVSASNVARLLAYLCEDHWKRNEKTEEIWAKFNKWRSFSLLKIFL